MVRAASNRMNDSGTVAWQVAEVLESKRGLVRLRFTRPGFCQRCSQGQGCGAGVFGALFSRRNAEVEMPCGTNFGTGQWVRVGVPAKTLLLIALCVYGLPLAGFLVGALPAYWWIDSPAWRDLLSLLGGLGLAALAWRAGGSMVRFGRRPHIEPLSCGLHATKSSTI